MGELILIKNGVVGYYPFSSMNSIMERGYKALNETLGVTEKMGLMMGLCSMNGWDCPASTKQYEVTEEQAKRLELLNKLFDLLTESTTMNTKEAEVAVQGIIEEVYPDKEWWQTMPDYSIFHELMAGWSVEEFIYFTLSAIR